MLISKGDNVIINTKNNPVKLASNTIEIKEYIINLGPSKKGKKDKHFSFIAKKRKNKSSDKSD